ncbi:MAG TPA: LiaF domain-containing protein [Acidimicrobiales bacterium]|nr:LiaF domain-containing protein [Acidimicrobiales bacterium]
MSRPAEDVVTRSGGDRSLLEMALLAAGTLWLLGELGLFHVAGRTLASVALVCIGAGLLVTRRTGRRRWPILVGGILALSLLGNSASANFRSEFGTSMGPDSETPTQLNGIHAKYEVAAGPLILDLSKIQFPPGSRRKVAASVGAGPLHVIVPSDVALRVYAHDTAGPVTVLGHDLGSGFDETGNYQDPDWSRTNKFRLTLDLHVGAGPITVDHPVPQAPKPSPVPPTPKPSPVPDGKHSQ